MSKTEELLKSLRHLKGYRVMHRCRDLQFEYFLINERGTIFEIRPVLWSPNPQEKELENNA